MQSIFVALDCANRYSTSLTHVFNHLLCPGLQRCCNLAHVEQFFDHLRTISSRSLLLGPNMYSISFENPLFRTDTVRNVVIITHTTYAKGLLIGSGCSVLNRPLERWYCRYLVLLFAASSIYNEWGAEQDQPVSNFNYFYVFNLRVSIVQNLNPDLAPCFNHILFTGSRKLQVALKRYSRSCIAMLIHMGDSVF